MTEQRNPLGLKKIHRVEFYVGNAKQAEFFIERRLGCVLGEMLDLIYTGHEPLAWQYFDMVWPAKKPGKEKFKADFNEALAESYYGTRNINTSNSMRNSMKLFEKIYKSIKEQ